MSVFPKISVVVPSFNHEKFVAHTLDSIINQNYPNVEILVMDGGSTDGTVEILRSYENQISWLSEPDGGQTDALIKGFHKSTGEYLCWLNSDDIMCNNSLWEVKSHAAANPDVIYGKGHYMDIDGRWSREYPTVIVSAEYPPEKAFFETGYVAQPSVFFSKKAYQEVGGLNPNRNLCMDYDLWVRLSRRDLSWVFVNKDLSGNRWYETTKTVSRQLDLLSEVVATQIENFNRVSEFHVQALSDYLYSVLHSRHFGDQDHIVVRNLLFKALWISLNYRTPGRAIEGALKTNIAPAGPIHGERMTSDAFLEEVSRRFSSTTIKQ